jgi:DNA-directed RNA polymerase specialized sigma24 family protein
VTDDVEQDVKDYIPWLRAHVREFASKGLVEEYYQEGLIAMWKGRMKWTPESGVKVSTFMMNSARYRWLGLRRGDMLLGQEPRTGMLGGHHDYLKYETSHDFSWTTEDAIQPVAPAKTDDLVYHYDEIHDAVGTLSEKQQAYITARFWLDMKKTEVQANGIDRSNWTRAKPILKEKLAHLREYV